MSKKKKKNIISLSEFMRMKYKRYSEPIKEFSIRLICIGQRKKKRKEKKRREEEEEERKKNNEDGKTSNN
jgi:hypothetical protein